MTPSLAPAPRRALPLLCLAALAAASLAPAPLPAQAPKIGAGAVAAQIGTGTLGTIVGFFGGGLAARALTGGRETEHASRVGYIGAYVGSVLLTPVGPALIGNRGAATGSYAAAQLGALAGFGGSALLKALGDRGAFDCDACGPLRVAAALGIVFLPSIGATVGFDRSRERER